MLIFSFMAISFFFRICTEYVFSCYYLLSGKLRYASSEGNGCYSKSDRGRNVPWMSEDYSSKESMLPLEEIKQQVMPVLMKFSEWKRDRLTDGKDCQVASHHQTRGYAWCMHRDDGLPFLKCELYHVSSVKLSWN